jgi:hypothetical protein
MSQANATVKGGGVLFSEMTPPHGAESHFNDWYSNHHMPSHVYGVSGFRSGQRYKDADNPDYLAIYDLESPDTLNDEEYRTRKYTPDAPTKKMLSRVDAFTRYIGEEISCQVRDGTSIADALDANVVLGFFYTVPDDAVAEFIEWHENQHTPTLMKNAEWRMVRHMKIVDADPHPFTHMIIHYVDSKAVLDCEELAVARTTEWRNRLVQKDWFKPHLVHYQRFGKRYHKGEPEAQNFAIGP